jgi:protein-disulfide isomerase
MRRSLLSIIALAALACSSSDAASGRNTAVASDSSAAMTSAAAAATPAESDSDVVHADLDRIQGDSSAAIWLVEHSDFQCPYCKIWHDSTYEMVRRDYVATGKVRMAYVNFPLEIHPNAFLAHETAMCAGAQGKFWEVHDLLYSTQPQWAAMSAPRPMFESLAVRAGADQSRIAACLDSGKMKSMIQADYDRGVSAGVRSTPSFLIAGQLASGAIPPGQMRQMLDAAIAAKK